MRNKLNITLEVVMLKEGDSFVPWVPALDLTSAGRTFAEAMKNIHEAIELFFEGCEEMGTLDQVLRECGWRISKKDHVKSFQPPHVVGNILENVALPA